MRRLIAALGLCLCQPANPALAQDGGAPAAETGVEPAAPAPVADFADLTFPYPVASLLAEPAVRGGYALPVAPFADGALPTVTVEGMIDRRAWRLDAPGAALLDVVAPLRDQIVARGFQVVFDCEARQCGGFDFRFATDVMAEPAMHVDLGDYHFVAARRGDEALGLLVSRAGSSAFVQMIRVGAAPLAVVPGGGIGALPDAPPAPVAPVGKSADAPDGAAAAGDAPPGPAAPEAATPPPADAAGRLAAGLPVVLEDLVFGSGSAALQDADYASLAVVADWLNGDAARRLALVGHSDASGGLQANVTLSKRRAEAVRQVLMQRLGVKGGQITAEGVGPLAPRDTNLTEEGRQRNRRVEAVPAP